MLNIIRMPLLTIIIRFEVIFYEKLHSETIGQKDSIFKKN